MDNKAVTHKKHGDTHHVTIQLNVLLEKDDSNWFAQGVEIDYAACGTTVEETKINFIQGLLETIGEHLKMHGQLSNLLQAPRETWGELFSIMSDDPTISTLDVGSENDLPFPIIAQFIEKQCGCAA